MAVHPIEFGLVEHGIFLRDAVEAELLAQHIARNNRGLAVEAPSQKSQEVHHRVGQIAARSVFLDARGAMALGELLAVGAQNHGEVRERRSLKAQCLINQNLTRRVGQVVVATNHMRDVHVRIVADHGEVIGRRAIGAHQNHVVHDIGRETHVAIHGVVELDGAMVLGHLQAPHMRLTCVDARLRFFGGKRTAGAVVARIAALGFLGSLALGVERFLRAEARVHRAALFELLQGSLVGVEALGLLVGAEITAHLGALVPIEAEPAHSAQNDLRVFLGGALGIGVLDAQHERAARGASKRPVVNSRAGATDMKLARWRRRETNAHARGRICHTNLSFQ